MKTFTFIQLILLYAVICILALNFGDRGWYEPDGVSILAGSLNLPQAKAGNFFLYAYALQPLTYELNYFVYQLFRQPYLLFLLPALFGALGICLLTLAVQLFSGNKLNIFFSFCFLLFFPELFYRLLYPNSSVFGMLFFSLALLLLFYNRPDKTFISRHGIKYLLTGVFSALACLFRCDFLLGLPMFIYLVIRQTASIKEIFFYALGAGVSFALGYLSGFFNPLEIIKISNFYSSLAQEPLYWSQERSFAVLFYCANIVVWFTILSYAAIKTLNAFYKKDWAYFFIFIALAALFYPLIGGLTSAHYLLAAIALAPFVVVSAARDFVKSSFAQKLKIRFNQIVYILVGIAILLQFFSLEVRRGYSCLPHFIITTKPAYLYTHDGPRVSGSYFAGYYRLYQSNKIPCLISPLGLAHVIAAQIKQSSSDFVMIYAKQRENNHLISLGLYSVPLFLEMHGYKISYGKDTLILTGKLNRLIIKELDSKAYENFKESSIYPAILMKIPLVSRTDYDLRQKLTLLFRQLTALPKK